jgi:hypothetical protein
MASGAKAPLDMMHVFATEAAGLARKLRGYRAAIEPDGMIWVSSPKKASGVATDLTDVVVRDTTLALGLVDIKVCAIDEVWRACNSSSLESSGPIARHNRRTFCV